MFSDWINDLHELGLLWLGDLDLGFCTVPIIDVYRCIYFIGLVWILGLMIRDFKRVLNGAFRN